MESKFTVEQIQLLNNYSSELGLLAQQNSSKKEFYKNGAKNYASWYLWSKIIEHQLNWDVLNKIALVCGKEFVNSANFGSTKPTNDEVLNCLEQYVNGTINYESFSEKRDFHYPKTSLGLWNLLKNCSYNKQSLCAAIFSLADFRTVGHARMIDLIDGVLEKEIGNDQAGSTKGNVSNNMANNKGSTTMTTLSNVKTTLVSDATKATYRVAANKVSKGLRTAIVDMVADKMDYKGVQKKNFKNKFASFLESPFGDAMISMMLGSLMPLAKSKLPQSIQPKAEILSEEFRVRAIATVEEEIIDTLLPMVSMFTGILTDSLSEAEQNQVRVNLNSGDETEEVENNTSVSTAAVAAR